MRADSGSKIFAAKVQVGLTRRSRNRSRADDMLFLLSVVMVEQRVAVHERSGHRGHREPSLSWNLYRVSQLQSIEPHRYPA
jgi:hypothetical protein